MLGPRISWAELGTGIRRASKSNPINRGLRYALLADQGICAVSGLPLQYTTSTISRIQRKKGRSFEGISGAGNAFGYISLSSPLTSNDITILVVCGMRDTFTSGANVLGGVANSAGNQFIGVQSSNGANNNTYTARQTNGGSTTQRRFNVNATTVSTDDPVAVVGRMSGNSTLDVFWDGLLDNGTLVTGSSGSNSWDRVSVGGLARSTNLGMQENNNAWATLVWDRLLSDDEVFQASKFLQKLFEPVARLWALNFGVGSGTNTQVNPGVGALTLVGPVPTIAQSADQIVLPGVGTLVLAGPAPTITQPVDVAPGAGSLSLLGPVPTISQAAGTFVFPGDGQLVLAGPVPTIAQSANQAVDPGVGALTLLGPIPLVQQSANLDILPGTGILTLGGPAPLIQQSGSGGGVQPWRLIMGVGQ